jgi:hypothetical protein
MNTSYQVNTAQCMCMVKLHKLGFYCQEPSFFISQNMYLITWYLQIFEINVGYFLQNWYCGEEGSLCTY